MAKHTLTERAVRTARLDRGVSETTLYDGEGLTLRVRAAQDAQQPPLRAWQFWYTTEGRRKRIGLGAYPEVGIASAREKAARYRELLRAGITPATTGTTTSPSLIPRTVAELVDRWESDYLRHHHKDLGAATRAAYNRHIAAAIGKTRLIDLRKLHVQHIVNTLTGNGKGRTAAAVLALMRQMFTWAIRHDFMAADPTAALVKAEFAGKSQSRERVLSADELRDLAQRLISTRRAGPEGRKRSIPVLPLWTQAAVWLMLSTLARVGELSQARWDEIDADAGTWLIPAVNSKNGKPHLIHLTPFALRHLRHLRQYAGDSPWVMPDRAAEDHIDTKAITKALRDRQQPAAARPRAGRSSQRAALLLPGGVFTAHDLRRTGATMMQGLGVAPEVIERCLNHVEENQLIRTYQRADLLPERAAAFAKLGAKLDALVPEAATQHLLLKKGGAR